MNAKLCMKNDEFKTIFDTANINGNRSISAELDSVLSDNEKFFNDENFVDVHASAILKNFIDIKLECQNRIFRMLRNSLPKFGTLNLSKTDVSGNENILERMSMDIVSEIHNTMDDDYKLYVNEFYDRKNHYKLFSYSSTTPILVAVIGNDGMSDMGNDIERVKVYDGMDGFKAGVPILMTADQVMDLQVDETIEETLTLYAWIWTFLNGYAIAANEVYQRVINKTFTN